MRTCDRRRCRSACGLALLGGFLLGILPTDPDLSQTSYPLQANLFRCLLSGYFDQSRILRRGKTGNLTFGALREHRRFSNVLIDALDVLALKLFDLLQDIRILVRRIVLLVRDLLLRWDQFLPHYFLFNYYKPRRGEV